MVVNAVPAMLCAWLRWSFLAEGQSAEALVEAGDLAAGVQHARLAAGPRRVDAGVDVEVERVALVAVGRARLIFRPVGHFDGDHVIIGMDAGLHRISRIKMAAGFRPAAAVRAPSETLALVRRSFPRPGPADGAWVGLRTGLRIPLRRHVRQREG